MTGIERSILGAIVLDGQLFEHSADIRSDDFSLESHRRIFVRMGDLIRSGKPIDIVTLVEELERHNELESVGGAGYVSGLMDGIPYPPSIQHYVKIMRATADRKRAAKLGEDVHRLAQDPSVPAAALAEIGNYLTNLGTSTDSLPPLFSEEALALRLSRKYGLDLRFVSRWGHWMLWDGVRWVHDDTLRVFDLCRYICRSASAECGDAKERAAMRIAAGQTVTAIERLARADRCHAATVDQWDTDPWMLNTPEGTVDLRTGEMHPHRRDEYITKITKTGPGELSVVAAVSRRYYRRRP